MKLKIRYILITGALFFAACQKGKVENAEVTPPPVSTPPAVVIKDNPDDGKDTIGKWETVNHRDVEGLAAWTQILFPAKDTGYLVNTAWLPTSSYSITFDGGKTWSPEYSMVPNNEFLYMIDGKTGMGYRTSAGTTHGSDVDAIFWGSTGISYNRVVYNASGIGGLQTSGISIPSKEFAYITFNNGECVRLQNPFNYAKYIFNKGGSVPSETNNIYFPDNATGWLCTSDGKIMVTKDSSKTWNTQLTVDNIGFSQIYFADQKTGWAASNANSFYKTTDGGANWVRSCKMGKENFQSITKQGNNVYVLSLGSERRTTPLNGGGTGTSSWTYATILKYQ